MRRPGGSNIADRFEGRLRPRQDARVCVWCTNVQYTEGSVWVVGYYKRYPTLVTALVLVMIVIILSCNVRICAFPGA
jgi:hypothetical protein